MPDLVIENNILLYEKIAGLLESAQLSVARYVNQKLVLTYFENGQMIVEDKHQGNERAAYAKRTLAFLSRKLTTRFGKGYSVSTLEYIRSFYIIYKQRKSQSSIGKSQDIFELSWTHYIQLLKIKDEGERNFIITHPRTNAWRLEKIRKECGNFLKKDGLSKNQPMNLKATMCLNF